MFKELLYRGPPLSFEVVLAGLYTVASYSSFYQVNGYSAVCNHLNWTLLIFLKVVYFIFLLLRGDMVEYQAAVATVMGSNPYVEVGWTGGAVL